MVKFNEDITYKYFAIKGLKLLEQVCEIYRHL